MARGRTRHDLSSQLTRAVFDSSNGAIADQDLQWTYDAAGNRTVEVRNGVSESYTTNSMNRYTDGGLRRPDRSDAWDYPGTLTPSYSEHVARFEQIARQSGSHPSTRIMHVIAFQIEAWVG